MGRLQMMRTRIGTGCGLVLLLAGCSADDGAPGAGVAASGSARPAVSPLDQYYGNGATASEEERDAEQRQVEELIVACMQAAGFDHTPNDPASIDLTALEERGEARTADGWSVEEAAQDGYLITTLDVDEVTLPVDPNEDYVASMSESESSAYYEALQGTRRLEDTYGQALSPEEAGCQRTAYTRIRGVDPASTPQFASLDEELTRTYDALEDAPESLALAAEWADCMAGAGHPGYADPREAFEDIRSREAALSSELGEGDAAADRAAVEELQEVEIATAVADAQCQQDVDHAARAQQLRSAAEQAFVEAHRAELEAMAEARGKDR